MNRTLFFIFTLFFISSSCSNMSVSTNQVEENQLSEEQQKLIDEGWVQSPNIVSQELSEEYGVTPRYGIQDNYFDIYMGKGSNIAIKIINTATEECIRYVYVKENSEITINQIPQGEYYLKIAYGFDWMELNNGKEIIGKFTTSTYYEKSLDSFNFGKKNSQELVNYELKINIQGEKIINNFQTTPINEEEFLK